MTKPIVSLTGCLQTAHDALYVHSLPLQEGQSRVQGCTMYESDQPLTAAEMVASFATSGFQATNLGKGAEIIRRMLRWRLKLDALSPEEASEHISEEIAPGVKAFSWAVDSVRERTRSTIFLSFTSNLISSGLREAFVFLAKHKLVDVICTTAGGIEEDFIKCLGEFVVGSFSEVKGPKLRSIGWNRIGNIYVPNDNYVQFESWLQPLLDEALTEQREQHTQWTASKLIERLGQRINNPDSLYYWCAKNKIPVFCPAITDGAIGDNLFFHRCRTPGLVIDVIEDVERINKIAAGCKKSGMIILGGGAAKHHICNANLLRNGADYAVYINTAQEFDGCDSGAAPDEAMSWGKIKGDAETVKVSCDATIAFPLLVGTVFREEKEFRIKERETWAESGGDYILSSPYMS